MRFPANAAEGDRSKAPKLLCRSLACLRIELGQNRIATSAKLKNEWERRSADNSVAADVLHANAQVWKVVKGPAPDELFHPTPQALFEARRAADDLEHIVLSQQQWHDGFDVFARECVEAARSLRPLDWGAIHAEKFPITPESVYYALVRNAEGHMRKQSDEERRRLAWLQQEIAHAEGAVPLKAAQADVYKCDPDVFKGKTGRLPHGWNKAVHIAAWIHIDEIRALLELHYGKPANELRLRHSKSLASVLFSGSQMTSTTRSTGAARRRKSRPGRGSTRCSGKP